MYKRVVLVEVEEKGHDDAGPSCAGGPVYNAERNHTNKPNNSVISAMLVILAELCEILSHRMDWSCSADQKNQLLLQL